MREFGRALGLDPTNAEATRAMMQLLEQPPKHLPPEVGEELDLAESEKTRKVGRFGAVAYASLVAYVPLLWWVGVRSLLPVVAFYAFIGGACAVSAVAAASRKPSPRLVLVGMLLSNVGCATTAAFFGPLLFMPAIVAINSTAFIAHLPRAYRWVALVVGFLCITVPFVLQAAGVTAQTYTFGPAGMTVAPGAIPLEPLPTTVFLAISALGMFFISALSVVQIRDALGDAERRLMVHAWHMRGLVGERGPSVRPRAGALPE
jgi:hypothetical protein